MLTRIFPEIEVRALTSPDPLADPQLLRDLRERYLVWDAFYAGARRVDIHPLCLPHALHQSAIEAAESTFAAIAEAADVAHRDPAERARYALHDDVHRLATASFSAGDRGSFARVDLLLDRDGTWKACEVNADCPGGQNEAHGLPRLAQDAGFRDGLNPTTVLEAMAERLAELAAPTGTVGLIHATAYAEDLQICALLKRALEELGVRAILGPPTAPKLDDRGRLTMNGRPLGALYRYFPTEYMEGQNNLDALVTAIASGSVRTFPSPAGIYSQSKLAFARAFALESELSPRSRRALRDHLPHSVDLATVPRDELVADRSSWVIKRALGRVGDQVFVGALHPEEIWPRLVDEVVRLRDEGEAWIAQKLVVQRPVPTPFGDRFVTLGAYVLDGRFVGYFARLSKVSHVSHDALCVPVFADRA